MTEGAAQSHQIARRIKKLYCQVSVLFVDLVNEYPSGIVQQRLVHHIHKTFGNTQITTKQNVPPVYDFTVCNNTVNA